jgi:hypothetical protein
MRNHDAQNMQNGVSRNSCAAKNVWSHSLALSVAVGALYWLYGWRPFLVQMWNVVDDGLYVRQAEGFLNWGRSGLWLGSFDCFLLAKAPLYGVWLALIHFLGFPLRVGEFLLLFAGGLLFRRAVSPFRRLRLLEFIVVLCLLIGNPFLPEDFILRRGGFQTALTNLCLIAAIGLALRALAGLRERQVWALLTGLFFSLCYLNREEATWTSVAILVAFLIQWLGFLLSRRSGAATWRLLGRGEALVALSFAIGVLPPILTVCALNKLHYGAFMTTFRRSSAFTSLYQRFTSLEPAGHQAYVPIARSTRMKAYDLSPTFAKMKPFLEGSEGYWHAGNAEHAALNGRSPADQEFFVSSFEFSLLWAAEKMGAKRADEMETTFRAIDRELGDAIREKKIVAGASGPAILAAPIPGDFGRICSALWTSFSSLLFVRRDGYLRPEGGQSSHSQLELVGQLTHSWVEQLPHTSAQYSMRAPILSSIKTVQKFVYPMLFLSLPGLLIWKRKEAFVRCPTQRSVFLWSMLVPMAGLFAFCLSMAIVEVLGFKFLAGMGYNLLGFAPLSVLCAFAFTGLVTFIPDPLRRRSTPQGAVEGV